MAISLSKGQTINLDKKANDLTSITIGLGWTIKKKSFFSKILNNDEFDLDAIAFLLDANGKMVNTGDSSLVGGDVVFFNNLHHHSGKVYHSGDNRVGGVGTQDDEQIVVMLESIPSQYQRIVFLVCIYQGIKKNQSFGEIDNAYMRAVDNNGNEIARYNLANDDSLRQARTLIFGEVYRKDGGWKFRALGEGDPSDTFVDVLKRHM